MKKEFTFKRVLVFSMLFFVVTNCIAQGNECLIGCYPLDNITTDFSGNNYDGTAYNVTPTTDHLGKINGAYHFTGPGSYILLPTTGYLIDKYTYSAWCRLSSYPVSGSQSASTILCIGGQNTDQVILMANDPTANHVGFAAGTWGSNNVPYHCYTGTLPVLNKWYHIAMTRDDSTMCFYIDDSLICSISSGNVSAGYSGSNLNASIGTRHTPGLQDFFGDIDEVRIYDCVLSQAQIKIIPSSCIYCNDSISQQPLNQGVNTGSNAQFSVIAMAATPKYQWQADVGFGFNNLSNAGPYSGVTTSTLTVSNANSSMNNYNFRCIISDTTGACVDTSLAAALTILTNIFEGNLINSFILYPNPSTGKFTISFKANTASALLKIFNSLGTEIYIKEIIDTIENESRIELKLSSGIYLIQLNDGQSSRIQKLVIQ